MMSLLNDDQKNAIIDILKEQCRCIQKANALERYMFPNLYDAQYMSGRHHSNTAKVYAGFQEDTLIPGMVIKKVSYGVQKWQPEISSDTAVIQLLTTPLFMLRCVQLGISIADLDLLTMGLVNDIFTERQNDEYPYQELASQADFDRF